MWGILMRCSALIRRVKVCGWVGGCVCLRARVHVCVFHTAIQGVVFSGSADRTVRAWDATSGSCLYVLEGHADWVSCVKCVLLLLIECICVTL